MFKNRKIYFLAILPILLAAILYHFSGSALVGRRIASVTEKIVRNRVIEPERSVEDVHVGSKYEEVVKLKNARIVIADYDLIKRDFPQVRYLSNPEIDDWILNQVAFISKPQAAQSVVNTPIPIVEQFRQAARPPEYGRALVFPMSDPDNLRETIGLIDVKGAGSLAPGQVDHGNGVATLGECLREFLAENLVRDVLDDADLKNKTVGSYAVIDAGFGVIHKDGSSSPAGLYLRQAHHRVTLPGAWLDADTRANLQPILKRYGIDPNQNIQGTNRNDIFDFGHYIVRDDMPETNKDKQIPYHLWGHDKTIAPEPRDRWFYSKKDYPWLWSHELADAFTRGDANRHHVWMHFENLLRPARAKLSTFRPKEYALNGYVFSKDVENFLKRTLIVKDLFIIENIKNYLVKNRMTDPIWKNYPALVGLLKNLELLKHDSDIELLHKLIVERALAKKKLSSEPIPIEIKKLILQLSQDDKVALGIRDVPTHPKNCLGMASDILQAAH